MFERAVMLYFYVETSLHAGTGRGVGAIDLPIQREQTTGYPVVYASGLKGRLRAEASAPLGENAEKDELLLSIFGNAGDTGAFGGAVSPGEARLLLFPVRSLAGVFAWTTSPAILQRFARDADALGLTLPAPWSHVQALAVGEDQALVAPANAVAVGTSGQVVLEELSLTAQVSDVVSPLAAQIARDCLPVGAAYQPWHTRLPRQLVILNDTVFRDFVQFSTEVVTRVRLESTTKTVQSGALWTEESLPPESLLYAPLYVARTRQLTDKGTRIAGAAHALSAEEVLVKLGGLLAHGQINHKFAGDTAAALGTLKDLELRRLRLGGDETVGRGLVAVRMSEPTTPGVAVAPAGEE